MLCPVHACVFVCPCVSLCLCACVLCLCVCIFGYNQIFVCMSICCVESACVCLCPFPCDYVLFLCYLPLCPLLLLLFSCIASLSYSPSVFVVVCFPLSVRRLDRVSTRLALDPLLSLSTHGMDGAHTHTLALVVCLCSLVYPLIVCMCILLLLLAPRAGSVYLCACLPVLSVSCPIELTSPYPCPFLPLKAPRLSDSRSLCLCCAPRLSYPLPSSTVFRIRAPLSPLCVSASSFSLSRVSTGIVLLSQDVLGW